MENKNWFVHVEWVVVLVTLLGGFYLLDGKIERQGARTDRLYEMFCEVQKQWAQDSNNMKDEIINMKKEQYEFMKENKK